MSPMPDTLSETPTEADSLRQEILALQAELVRLRAVAVATARSLGPVTHHPQGSVGRRLAFRFYRLVRPVVRPVAWRIRTFMLGPVLQELAEMRTGGRHSFVGADASSRILDPGLALAVERLLLTLALEERSPPR